MLAFEKLGHVYSRVSNPTVECLEFKLAALEGGSRYSALALSSGMTAVFYSIVNVCQVGDEVVASCGLYGGTATLFVHVLKQFGITVHFVDHSDPLAFARAITPRTQALFCESVSNPGLVVADIPALADIAHAHDLPLIVDATFVTPVIQRPLELGADIVVHSLTKWLSGHGAVIGGVVIDGGRAWSAQHFPLLSEPDEGYHGVSFLDLPEVQPDLLPYITRMRAVLLRNLGGCLSPDQAWQIDQSLPTLEIRMQAHCDNALAVAEFLLQYKQVAWVHYPGLPGDRYHALCQQVCQGIGGGMVVFGLKDDAAGVRANSVVNAVNLVGRMVSVGDVRSMILHPASSTHGQLDEDQLTQEEIGPDMIRLSVGLENVEDVIADLAQAIDVASAEGATRRAA